MAQIQKTFYRSTCRCCCSPGIEPAGCAAPRVRGGSSGPSDRSPPPGCRGSPAAGGPRGNRPGTGPPAGGEGSSRCGTLGLSVMRFGALCFWVGGLKVARVSPFHRRALAGGASLQDCSPGAAGLTPKLHRGQEATQWLPGNKAVGLITKNRQESRVKEMF